jgi:sensor histidine kinase YesM
MDINGKTPAVPKNRLFFSMTLLYVILLLYVSFLACFFAWQKENRDLLAKTDMTADLLRQEYQTTMDGFWQTYLSIYEKNSDSFSIIDTYYPDRPHPLTPWEQLVLTRALSQLLLLNTRVKWIALYSVHRSRNYILYRSSNSLQDLSAGFPFMQDIRRCSSGLEIYPTRPAGPDKALSFAICGSVPLGGGEGCFLLGYDTERFNHVCADGIAGLKSLDYTIQHENAVVFDSASLYGSAGKAGSGSFIVRSRSLDNRGTVLLYRISKRELLAFSHRNTPAILIIVLVFSIISAATYSALKNAVSREVAVIKNGLVRIGENNLAYQIPTTFRQSGLPEIAASINAMTTRLSENINRAYYFEIRQKETELAELQSKFNPHFLYNTLEMLRARSYQNGDSDTAELITGLADIFRGFISSKTFIPIAEELAFSKRYLSLFSARYGDSVRIRYHIDTDVLQYGVIRNVFQPLIENYFIHGFDTAGSDNYILFRGCSSGEKTLLLSVEDNGTGMADSELKLLNEKLGEPFASEKERYGLKNLHQRLQLFYGNGCGLEICRNGEKGICVRMTILKMTCDEYERSRTAGAPVPGSRAERT